MTQRPQQPELARSRQTPIDQTQRARQSADQVAPPTEGEPGTVPEENQPGHDHGDDPDKPDPERFRRRFEGQE